MASDLRGRLNNELAVGSLNYHGQQLTSFLKDEPLFMHLDLRNVDYHEYTNRSRELRMEDRGKRLLLHKFISTQSEKLFTNDFIHSGEQCYTVEKSQSPISKGGINEQ